MRLIDTVFQQMSNVSKPQRKFIIVLLSTIIVLRGKVNFRNLSRYSELCEKTYSRQLRKLFDYTEFNRIATSITIPSIATQIAVMDCSFISKSGRHTYGLDKFYNSKLRKAEKGLEISELAIVDGICDTPYAFCR